MIEKPALQRPLPGDLPGRACRSTNGSNGEETRSSAEEPHVHCKTQTFRAPCSRDSELPPATRHEVPDSTRSAVRLPDLARLERATTLTKLRAGHTLTG